MSDEYGFEIIDEYRNPRLPSLSENYSKEQPVLPCDISKEMKMLKFPKSDIRRYKQERKEMEAADVHERKEKENWVVVTSSKSREYYVNRKLKKFALSNAIWEKMKEDM